MKGILIHWHKARLKNRYVLEMKLHRVDVSRKNLDGIRYRLIVFDEKTKRRVLMDNHHPKGHHIHVDEGEAPYRFVDEETLVNDFRALVLEFMGVKL